MCHPGRVNGSGLIGSPYSALEPISASRMMYTSLNACRQWQLPPFIQASHDNPPPSHPRAQAYVQHMQMGKTVHTPPLPRPPLCICPVLSSIIRPIKVCKVERWRANTHVPLFGRSLAFVLVPAHLPLICTELVDRGHFWISGQLHQIQKDIRGPPAAILRATMR